MPKSILDRSFHYTPSSQTDVRKTFRRVRREQQDALEAQRKAQEEATAKVRTLKGAAK